MCYFKVRNLPKFETFVHYTVLPLHKKAWFFLQLFKSLKGPSHNMRSAQKWLNG
jgi:hypothetical protein